MRARDYVDFECIMPKKKKKMGTAWCSEHYHYIEGEVCVM